MIQQWQKFQNYFFQRNLKSKLSGPKVKRSLTNLTDAKTVGIVYESGSPDNDIIITKFAEELRKQGKIVEVLNYVHDTKIDHKADVTVFNKSTISWCLVPNDERVDKFIAKPFDVLFAAYTAKSLPLDYVVSLSHSKCRVGVFEESKTHQFELMVNTNAKADLTYFLQQATHYLNQIHYDSK